MRKHAHILNSFQMRLPTKWTAVLIVRESKWIVEHKQQIHRNSSGTPMSPTPTWTAKWNHTRGARVGGTVKQSTSKCMRLEVPGKLDLQQNPGRTQIVLQNSMSKSRIAQKSHILFGYYGGKICHVPTATLESSCAAMARLLD